MNLRIHFSAVLLGAAVCWAAAAIPAKAQVPANEQHVVTSDELSKSAEQPADTREANEGAVRHLLTSDAGRQALESANIDYRRVDKAIGQLSDEELAKLADRSRQAESDFAAGLISAKTLAYIILAVVVIVVIIVLV